MAHYAFLNEKNVVIEVIAGIDEDQTIEGLTPEIWYGNFRNQRCVRTSYNANIRGKYAGIGDTYDEQEDIFISPQPYPSWIRTGSYWQAPVPLPENEKGYKWNEEKLQWDEI